MIKYEGSGEGFFATFTVLVILEEEEKGEGGKIEIWELGRCSTPINILDVEDEDELDRVYVGGRGNQVLIFVELVLKKKANF